MPMRPTLCDLGAPGRGSPGFRSGLCFSLPCFVLLICCFSLYQSIWWCIRHHPFNCAGRVNLPLCLFCLGLFLVSFLFLCGLFVAFVCFAFVWFFWLNWHCDDSIGLCIWSFSSTVFLVHPCPKMEHHCFFFPSNAFMAFARSLHTFNRSKKMNCKLSCKAVYTSIASKALVMDLYTVQWAVPSKTNHKKGKQTNKTHATTTKPKPKNTEKWDRYQLWEIRCTMTSCVSSWVWPPKKKQNKDNTEQHKGAMQEGDRNKAQCGPRWNIIANCFN